MPRSRVQAVTTGDMSYIPIDDYSPMIKYQGQWVDAYNSTSDPAAPLYNDQTYHTTQLDGATVSELQGLHEFLVVLKRTQATVRFMGTEVRIFGAKRPDHGFYNVSIDGGTPEQYDGYAPVQPDGKDGLFQVVSGQLS